MTMPPQERMERRAEGLTIISEPETEGSPRKAGLGVGWSPDEVRGAPIEVMQLWDNGDAEPVYVEYDELDQLIASLQYIRAASEDYTG